MEQPMKCTKHPNANIIVLCEDCHDLERSHEAMTEHERAGRLKDEINYLRAALEKIARREGPYALDPHAHACNVITAMAEVAEGALAGTWKEDDDDD